MSRPRSRRLPGQRQEAPANQHATLLAQNRALVQKVKALIATSRALAAEAKFQTDRNVALSTWIIELNKRIGALGGGPVALPVDPDQDCRDHFVCTVEQECRVWGNNCALVQPLTPPADAIPSNNRQG